MRWRGDFLEKAVESKDIEQIKQCLTEDWRGSFFPLTAAIKSQDVNIVKLVIEYCGWYNEWNGTTKDAFYSAVKEGNLEIIKYLSKVYPEALSNEISPIFAVHLHTAVENKHIQVIKYFLSKGVNVNVTNKNNKKTALHIASQLGSLEIVNLLIENKADVNALDKYNQTPLYEAVDKGHTEVVKVLIRAGTDLNHKDFVQCPVLNKAIQKDRIEILEELIQFGADVFQEKYFMVVAVANNLIEVVKIFQKAGLPLTAEDDFGDNPLMIACGYGHFLIAEYLLENGVAPNILRKNNTNISNTPLCNCIQGIKDPNVFEKFLVLLLEYNVNLEQNFKGKNAFSYAIEKRNFPAAALLVKYGFDVNCIDETCLQKSFTKKSLNITKTFITITKKRKPNSSPTAPTSIFEDGDYFIKFLICAGFNFKNVRIFKDVNDDISMLVENLMSKPRSLQDLCRIRIRKSFGNWVMINLYKLPLPKVVHDFLALDIL